MEDRKERIRQAIAAELKLPVEVLHDGATVASVGLDSLGLAQSVVAVETALEGEIDTEALSARLVPDLTLGGLIEVLEASLVGDPAGSAA